MQWYAGKGSGRKEYENYECHHAEEITLAGSGKNSNTIVNLRWRYVCSFFVKNNGTNERAITATSVFRIVDVYCWN